MSARASGETPAYDGGTKNERAHLRPGERMPPQSDLFVPPVVSVASSPIRWRCTRRARCPRRRSRLGHRNVPLVQQRRRLAARHCCCCCRACATRPRCEFNTERSGRRFARPHFSKLARIYARVSWLIRGPHVLSSSWHGTSQNGWTVHSLFPRHVPALVSQRLK